MRVIVTGGAGFIGSHIVDVLTAAGDRALVIDNFSSGHIANLQSAMQSGVGVLDIDVRDQDKLIRAVASFRPEMIFHFAAHIDVRKSVVAPAADAQSNILGSVNVLTAALKHEVRRVVNASTGGAIYGDAAVIPTPETAPALPISPYGISKLAAETYAQWFRGTCGLDVVTLRLGNVYGPRQNPAYGAVVSRFCDRVIQGAEVEIFGTGSATRDYIHVADVAAACLATLARERLSHSVYNIGTGRETTVGQLARMVAELAGSTRGPVRVSPQPARTAEVSRSCLDISRARSEGIIRIPTTLRAGIGSTLEWARSQCWPRDDSGLLLERDLGT